MHEGGKGSQKVANQVFCKAFVCRVWKIKADSCNISVQDAAQTSKGFLSYLTERPVQPLHQLKTAVFSLGGEQVGACGGVCRELTPVSSLSEQLKQQPLQKGEKLSQGGFFLQHCKDRSFGVCGTHVPVQTPCMPWSFLTMEFIQIIFLPPLCIWTEVCVQLFLLVWA